MHLLPARGALRAASLVAVAVLAAAVPTAARAYAPIGVTNTASALAGARFWVNPANPAGKAAAALRRSRPREAGFLEQLARVPTATWLGGWVRDVRGEVRRIVETAGAQGAIPVLVAYNIPNRDCGEHSAGGERDAASYRKWIRDFAAGLADRRAVVVVEPDAVALTRCLSERQQRERFELLADAVRVLRSARATVYLDAGNARWMKPQEMAARLRRAGIDDADGFALNVSNFIATPTNVAFGESLSRLVGGKHFIIDTSRNGAGTATGVEWCNAPGQAVGTRPTTNTGHPLVDAFLWIKQPGESDGTCAGGPRAGTFWNEYAVGLAQRGL
jgi:endoglucanase